MQALFAIVRLTWTAAFRYRLFWVIMTLLLGAVVGLPLLIKHDGTAEGFAQILITYTLGAVTVLLGLCTLWLACGTLARDIEECQMQMIVVKPIARWQVWLGKWLGLVSLNAALLGVSGLSIYSLLEWRAHKLEPKEYARLQNEVLVARASLKLQVPEADIDQQARQLLEQMRAQNKLGNGPEEPILKKLREQVKTDMQVLQPSYILERIINLGAASGRLRDQPLFLRVKFNASQTSPTGTFPTQWQVGNPEKNTRLWRNVEYLSPDTFHEIQIDPNLYDSDGNLKIMVGNPTSTALLFTLDEGVEVLYRESSFGLNFARGLAIILCWMALLAALGLAAASFLSFPVAAFCCLALMSIVLSNGTLAQVVSEGTVLGVDEEGGLPFNTSLDFVAMPAFRVMLQVVNLVLQFSPVDALSTGRSIEWSVVGRAFAQIVILMGGGFAIFGIVAFSRRELATAQGTH